MVNNGIITIGGVMKIKKIIDDIYNIRKELLDKTEGYFNGSQYTLEIDNRLNAKARLLTLYLKQNKLYELENLINNILPIDGNTIEFCEIFDSITDEILKF